MPIQLLPQWRLARRPASVQTRDYEGRLRFAFATST